MRRSLSLVGLATGAVAVAVLGTVASAAEVGGSTAPSPRAGAHRATLEELALPLGLQTSPKHGKRPHVKVAGTKLKAANPSLALLPDPAEVDFAFWADRTERRSLQRGDRRAQGRVVTPFLYEEQEPRGTRGGNDDQPNAEPILGFGTDEQPAVRVSGALTGTRTFARRIRTKENQGSIPLATATRIPLRSDEIRVESRIGDGPHGRKRSGRGDFDFYKVRARAGESILASTILRKNPFRGLDSVIVIYDAEGNVLGANDDSGPAWQSELEVRVEEAGPYYVMVAGFASLPENPFRAGSGTGAGAEGSYRLRLSVAPRDRDMYAVELEKGDVLGGRVEAGASTVEVFTPDGSTRVGSSQNASALYPMASPLPAGGNGTFAYVAEEAGMYAVSASRGRGRYDLQLEVYRPGAEQAGATQRIYLDFDGERVNTGVFGGWGASDLSPLSAFLGGWGLTRDDEDAIIDRVVATVEENLKADLEARGLNEAYDIEVLNSRDHADPFGQPDVSRVVVGGTIEESGVPTIGIAQSIDPGNYERAETALVLLDVLSGPRREWGDASLNFYLRPRSDRVGFVGTAVGNVVSHEVGHFIGSYHVDQFNDVLNLMDQGGNFPLLYAVGEDGVGGTADDPDVDFGVDTYNPGEGFTGLEDTLNVSAWSSTVS
jgi:hypothetical protein